MASNLERRIAKLERFLYEQHANGTPAPRTAKPLRRVQSAWKDAAPDERMAIIAWIQDQLQNDPDLLDHLG